MMDKINILCATDDNYVPYCGIMLTSIFLNHPKGSVIAYVLMDKQLSSQNIAKFDKLARKYSNQIIYVSIDKDLLKDIAINGMPYWTIATYYRLYAAHLLPETVKYILYLDCDIVVNGDISSLWKMDWEGIAAGVVPDIFNDDDRNYNLLSYSKELGYFNAGVVFMNLEYWREHMIGESCLEYLKANSHKLQSNDQDVLNYILKDCKRNISLTYNFQIQFLSKYFRSNIYSESFLSEIDEIRNPRIVHYAAQVKPWMIKYYGMPYGKLWHKYKFKSPWKCKSDIWPEKKRLKMFVKRYLLWPLHLRRPATPFVDNIII